MTASLGHHPLCCSEFETTTSFTIPQAGQSSTSKQHHQQQTSVVSAGWYPTSQSIHYASAAGPTGSATYSHAVPLHYREQAKVLEEEHNMAHPEAPIKVEIVTRYKPPCCHCGDKTYLCLLISVPMLIILPLVVYSLHKLEIISPLKPSRQFEELLVLLGVVALVVFIAFTFVLLTCEARSTNYEYGFVSFPLNTTYNAPVTPDESPTNGITTIGLPGNTQGGGGQSGGGPVPELSIQLPSRSASPSAQPNSSHDGRRSSRSKRESKTAQSLQQSGNVTTTPGSSGHNSQKSLHQQPAAQHENGVVIMKCIEPALRRKSHAALHDSDREMVTMSQLSLDIDVDQVVSERLQEQGIQVISEQRTTRL